MRARLRLAAVALVALVVPGLAAAEPTAPYLYAVPSGGYTMFDGTLRVPTTTLRDEYYVGGRLGFRYLPWLGVEAAGGWTPSEEDIGAGAPKVTFWHASGNLVLTPTEGIFGGPFLLLGGGISRLNPDNGSDIKQNNFEIGGGLQFWPTDLIGVRVEGRDLMWMDSGVRTHTIMYNAGLTIALGASPRDDDHDGVATRHDRCPDTPMGATVDANGCPHDSDDDGVLDGLDQCPNTMKGATVDAQGCPHDSDGDGVFDGIDECPDTPKGATVDAKGCPHDSDGDGVLDGLDQCPDTPKGCTVDEKGCPHDSDGDGVCDGIDECPDTDPGLAVNDKGCPVELIKRETELLDTGKIRLSNVNFETGKATLLPESLPSIDIVGHLLLKWPELKIEVAGHTDSRGSAALNQKLSEARAQSVLDYLLQKFPGLNPDNFTVKGYGERRPIASNNTEGGRARNRRVEFVVLNKAELLRHETESREMLKRGEVAPDTTGAPVDTTGAAPDTSGSMAPGGGTTPEAPATPKMEVAPAPPPPDRNPMPVPGVTKPDST